MRIYSCLCTFRIELLCTKDYTNGLIQIDKGTLVTAPTYALHHLEEYYADPEKFDPDSLEFMNW